MAYTCSRHHNQFQSGQRSDLSFEGARRATGRQALERVWKRSVTELAAPMGLLAALLLSLSRYKLPPIWDTIDGVLPGIVMGAGALIAWRFKRYCVVWAMVTMAAAWVALTLDPRSAWQGFSVSALWTGLSLSLPLCFALLGVTGEVGTWTLRGATRNLAIGALIGFTLWLALPAQLSLVRQLEAPFLPISWLSSSGMSSAAITAHGVAGIILVVALWRRWGMLSGGFLAACAASALTFAYLGRPSHSVVFLTAGALALTVANLQESYNMAYLDELTQLPGRRALNEELGKLGRKYTIAMLDVDHFKSFNDKYGHDVGDDVLRMVAEQMRRVTGGGQPFRYGGEEFTILFPGKAVLNTDEHLEAVREAIEAASMTVTPKRGKGKGRKVSVTISIGAAQRGAKYRTTEEVIKAADKALYRAKRRGRNRVHVDKR